MLYQTFSYILYKGSDLFYIDAVPDLQLYFIQRFWPLLLRCCTRPSAILVPKIWCWEISYYQHRDLIHSFIIKRVSLKKSLKYWFGSLKTHFKLNLLTKTTFKRAFQEFVQQICWCCWWVYLVYSCILLYIFWFNQSIQMDILGLSDIVKYD